MGDFLQSDFNQISAWFEIMLEDAYPKKRVSSIYYQRTVSISLFHFSYITLIFSVFALSTETLLSNYRGKLRTRISILGHTSTPSS